MKASSLTKAFFISAALTIASLGLAACATERAKNDNPNFEKSLASNIESRFARSLADGDHKNWHTGKSSWSFPADHDIEVKIVSEDLKIKAGSGTEIKIEAQGKNKDDQSPLLNVETNNKSVVLSQKNNDEVHGVSVTIWIPRDAKPNLVLKTVSGDIEIENVTLQEVSATTVSGDIELKGEAFEVVKLKSVSGDIELERGSAQSVDALSISGDIKIKLSNKDVRWELRSLSGKIQSPKSSESPSAAVVKVQTTSGDIEAL